MFKHKTDRFNTDRPDVGQRPRRGHRRGFFRMGGPVAEGAERRDGPNKDRGAAKDAADTIGAWSAVKAVSAVGMADVAAEWAAAVSARALAVIWGRRLHTRSQADGR